MTDDYERYYWTETKKPSGRDAVKVKLEGKHQSGVFDLTHALTEKEARKVRDELDDWLGEADGGDSDA